MGKDDTDRKGKVVMYQHGTAIFVLTTRGAHKQHSTITTHSR